MTKTLPSIRITERSHANIAAAVKKYNRTSLTQMTMQEFRRLSYILLSQLILQDKPIPINLKLEQDK